MNSRNKQKHCLKTRVWGHTAQSLTPCVSLHQLRPQSRCITGQEGSCRRWAGTTAESVVIPDGVAISVLDLAPPSERVHWTKLHTWDLCTFSCVCSEKVFPTPLSSSSEKLRCGQKAMPTLHVSKRSFCRSPCCSEVKACQAQALYPHPLLLLHSWQQLSSEVLEAEAFWQL